jgi:hypothetical protein
LKSLSACADTGAENRAGQHRIAAASADFFMSPPGTFKPG